MTDKKGDKDKDKLKAERKAAFGPLKPGEKKEESNFDKMMKGLMAVPPMKKKKKED